MLIKIGSKKNPTIKNKAEWRNERRAKMLSQMGYKPQNIEAMMYAKDNNIRGQHVKKWLKHDVKPAEMDLRDKTHL